MAVARVQSRVKAGGHHVPERVVRRRYGKSLRNFDLYRRLATSWRVYDGSAPDVPPLIACGADDHSSVIDAERWNQVRETIDEQ